MNCLSAERYLLLRHDALPQHGAPEEAASRGVATLMSFTIRSDGVLPSLSTWRGMVPGGPAPAAPEQPEQPIAERAGASPAAGVAHGEERGAGGGGSPENDSR